MTSLPPSMTGLVAIDLALRGRRVPSHYRRALLEELQAHARERVAALEHEGLSTDDAWRVAVADLGPPDDVAEMAATTVRTRVHRAPVTTMIVGPALLYVVIAVGVVPLTAIALLSEATLVRSLGGLSVSVYCSAVLGSVLMVTGLSRMASAHPGVDRYALVGSLLIAVLCGLLHPTGSAESKTLQVVFEPTTNALLLMLPALAATVAVRPHGRASGWR